MSRFLSTDTVLFTILGYPMSPVELVGTLLYLWSVWLIARRNMLTWPVGIASVLLYLALFYQIQLYADAFEQVYYLGASVYGWWYWSRSRQEARVVADFRYSTRGAALLVAAVTALLSVAFGAVTSRLHVWMPAAFPKAASYPYIDAGTTIMSFTAMWLMARKRIESWTYWIAVDLIGIWLYFVKGVRFVSLLYVILLVLAIKGLGEWRRAWARAPAVGLP